MKPKDTHHKPHVLIVDEEGDDNGMRIQNPNATMPRGKPKSGKTWKTEHKKSRFSQIKRDKHMKTSWNKKEQTKAMLKSVKNYENELKAARSQQLEDKRKRRAEHAQRRLENERKSEIVQKIKNPAKIKRMKKKQLRSIQTR